MAMKVEFNEAIEKFTVDVEGLRETVPAVMKAIEFAVLSATKEFQEFIAEHAIKIQEEDDRISYTVPAEAFEGFRRLNRSQHRARVAHVMVQRSLLVSLVSAFDCYLGRLIRAIYLAQPKLLNTCSKQIDFTQLLSFSSLDDAKEFVIDKEVETVLRDSHAEQFKWLSAKLSIPLQKDLNIWPTFIELTERRNLFVHSDGIVSSQYLNICRDNGVTGLEGITLQSMLPVGPKYFDSAAAAVLEIGVKLGHVAWRKLLPSQRNAADVALNSIAYRLITEHKYDLAICFLEFATNVLKTYSSEEARLIFVINLSQAYKWANRSEDCERVITSVDWSATSPKFKLGREVLLDHYAKAADLMRAIGRSQEVPQVAYRDWPLFQNWVKSPEFLTAYKDTFGVDFATASTEVSDETSHDRPQLPVSKRDSSDDNSKM
jgi:hypothetical protein